ncbi:MAG: hypothetical protein JKY65_01895 [Planctomycetes bacterium]|nr:hypothetical protein [Planctomycetota bacterium]
MKGERSPKAEEDFTEQAYSQLLALVLKHWVPVGFSRALEPDSNCLWRHDIDFSPQRAARLAELEADAGITATYFVHLHSTFYNALEPDSLAAYRRILAGGHELGLHVDLEALGPRDWTEELAHAWIRREGEMLTQVAETKVRSISFHNPTEAGWLPRSDEVAGYVNAYGPTIQKRYRYCSDSNGRWRFDRLEDVLREGRVEPLHVLTHPCWWPAQPMAARARVERCIEGRAQRTLTTYVNILSEAGRTDTPDPRA